MRGGPGKIGTEFDGPDDAAGVHSLLMVMVMGLPDWGIDKRTPADFLHLRLVNVQRTVNDWSVGKDETGVINGIPFARVRWAGTLPGDGRKITGFMYCGREGTYVIEIQAKTLESNADSIIPLLDAAAMTLKKVQKPLV